jgi:hypothetical protein
MIKFGIIIAFIRNKERDYHDEIYLHHHISNYVARLLFAQFQR